MDPIGQEGMGTDRIAGEREYWEKYPELGDMSKER